MDGSVLHAEQDSEATEEKGGGQGFRKQQIKCLCGQVVGWWVLVDIGRVNEKDGGRL